jgi:DeoR/GlpR family transcriptional regulator of sugar metabolism
MRVTIDTIQRDLKLLDECGYLQRSYPPLVDARYGLPVDSL